MEIQQSEYLKNGKSFLNEIKSIFHNYVRSESRIDFCTYCIIMMQRRWPLLSLPPAICINFRFSTTLIFFQKKNLNVFRIKEKARYIFEELSNLHSVVLLISFFLPLLWSNVENNQAEEIIYLNYKIRQNTKPQSCKLELIIPQQLQ